MSAQEFIDDEIKKQQEVIKKQNEDLDQVVLNIGTIKDISYNIGNELDTQHEMLNRFENSVDKTKGSLQNTNNKLKQLLTISDKGKIICIIVLIIVIAAVLTTAIFILNN